MRLDDPVAEYLKTLRHAAIRLLARREHSAEELRQKLGKRQLPDEISSEQHAELIAQLLDELQGEGLQSDHRFAESYAHMRINKGYGPQRIDNELRERGVSESIRRNVLQQMAQSGEVDWWALMQQVREKKFGQTLPEDYASRSKQMRFLQYRGFASEAIRELFS